MTNASYHAAMKAHRQAASLMEAAMLPALEKRAETLSVHEGLHFESVERLHTAPVETRQNTRTITGGMNGRAAGRAVLHARGISLPGAERMNGSTNRRGGRTGFSVGL